MNLASVRAVRTTTALAMLLCGLPAAASTGGDDYVRELCLDRTGKRILYFHGDYSESGNADGLEAVDLASGKRTVLIEQGAPGEQPSFEPHLERCTPLKAATLKDVGVTATVRAAKSAPVGFDAKTLPEYADTFQPRLPYVLELSSGGTQEFQPQPSVPYERMMNDAGMALYRAGRLDAAADYFENAFEAGRYARRPYPLAQFNRAAALAKAGKKKKEALEALAKLFSFKQERQRFREKVKKDKDFDSLRGDEQFQKLMTDEDCCQGSLRDRSTENERSRTEWWWREGELVVHLEQAWRWGKLVYEQREDGSAKQWYDDGRLRTESSMHNGTGWVRHYREDGTVSLDERYVNGVKQSPDAGLLP